MTCTSPRAGLAGQQPHPASDCTDSPSLRAESLTASEQPLGPSFPRCLLSERDTTPAKCISQRLSGRAESPSSLHSVPAAGPRETSTAEKWQSPTSFSPSGIYARHLTLTRCEALLLPLASRENAAELVHTGASQIVHTTALQGILGKLSYAWISKLFCTKRKLS